MKNTCWVAYGSALATTTAIAFVLCSIFDLVFKPYGLIRFIESATPWPISGDLLGFITGLFMFGFAGFVLGAIYGISFNYWQQKCK